MKTKRHGFSLLEVITVLAIVGIIAALFISGVSAHRKAVLMAKTRIQFLQYESAINMYCKEYGDLPTFFCHEELVSLADGKNSETFVKILSGRTPYGKQLSAEERKTLNPNGKEFHTFSDSEFFLREDGTRDYNSLADAFNNRNIFIVVEDPFDEDTIVSREKFPDPVQRYIGGKGVKNSVVIYSVSDDGKTILSNCIDQHF